MNVTSGAGTVTGNVTLTVDGGAPLSQALNGGAAVFTLLKPALGTRALVANFAAQGTFAASSATGSLLVNQAPLTITANNATRAFGAANPTFTATYAGFVNGDTPASLTGTLGCTTTATAASLPGPYPITCSGQTSTNYNITYVPGVLTITAVGPVLTLQPTTLTFSSVPNVTTAPQLITVSNAGGAPLRITGISLGGANVALFAFTHNCPIGGTGLVGGGNCTINVTFTPNNNPITRSALVRVNVASPAVSQTVALTGTSIIPFVGVTPTSLAFGSVPVRTTSAPQPVTVSNTGTVPLIISSIAIGGTNSSRFAQTNNCPIGGTGLAPGSSCTVNVTFGTPFLGPASATLNVRDNAPPGIQRVALTGTGI